MVTLSDEVYDFLTFDDCKHTVFATVGNNWDRTVSIYSGGKLLNVTGWRIGWAIAPPELLQLGGIISNGVFYCCNVPGQIAIANSMDQIQTPGYSGDLSFLDATRQLFIQNRDYIAKRA